MVHVASKWPTCHTTSDINQTNTGCQGVLVLLCNIVREEAAWLYWDKSERDINVFARFFELALFFALSNLILAWSAVL